jgi:hypothetical protein
MRINKKLVVASSTVSILALGAGVAYAYWSSDTSGTGAATTTAGTALSTILPADVTAPTNLYPGASGAVSFNVKNPAPYRQKISAASVVIDPAFSVTAGSSTCTPADFTITPPASFTAAFVAASGQLNLSGWTLAMVDEDTRNQNACKNLSTIPLSISVTGATA